MGAGSTKVAPSVSGDKPIVTFMRPPRRLSEILRRPDGRWWAVFRGWWIAIGLVAGTGAHGATHVVANEAALAAALANAAAGDEIVVRDGNYRGNFQLAQSGTAERPILVRAEHPLKALLRDSLFELKGNHGGLRGLVFEGSQVGITGSFNDVGHNLFRNGDTPPPPKMKGAVWTSGGASHNRIHHNELTRWSTFGFRIWQPEAQTTGNRIDHNYVHDYSNQRSGNEPEVFQVGSTQASSNVNVATIVEYNLVERVSITGELLSLKSSGNLIRGNTFIDIRGSVQGRHGCNNTFLNNTLMGGKTVLRAYGDNHRLIGNRLVGADIVVSPGDVTQDQLRKIDDHGTHPAARHQIVAGNVLEQGGKIRIGEGGRESFTIPAQDTSVAGNTGPVVSEGPGLRHTGTTLSAAYEGEAGTPVLMTRAEVGPGAPDAPAGAR
jgi:poly(beta-D-mannuronate) lyase